MICIDVSIIYQGLRITSHDKHFQALPISLQLPHTMQTEEQKRGRPGNKDI